MDRKWLTFAVLAAGLVVVSLLVGLSADGGSTGPPLQLERATATDGTKVELTGRLGIR